MIYDRAGEFRNEGTTAEQAVIAAAGVRLINTERGRLTGGLRMDVGGSAFVNEAGAILRNGDPFIPNAPAALIGSSGADFVDNAGAIVGAIDLGDGADTFIGRSGSGVTAGSQPALSLGAGGDSARLEGVAVSIDAGSGADTLTLAGASLNFAVPGNMFRNFETLVFENGAAIDNIAGLTRIDVRAQAPAEVWTTATLVNSALSQAAVNLIGGNLRLVTSTVSTVTGTAAAERLELVSANAAGAVDLGGGDDVFWLEKSFVDPGTPMPTFGAVAGGAGQDQIRIQTWEGQNLGYDFGRVTGFESLAIGYNVFATDTTVRISNLAGVTAIDAVEGTNLVLTDSSLAGAAFWGSFGARVTLAGTTVLGSYGPHQPGFDTRTDIETPDDRLSTVFVNGARVVGNVQFYTGDDVYDGRTGAIGGKVFGNAGNDLLLGGAGNDVFEGNFGADTLDGGGGDDRLDGGSGGDRLFGGAGDDVLVGGAGDDLLDGGAGYETLSYAVLYRGGAVTRGAGTEVVIAAGGDVGTDTLRRIDDVVMKDGLLSFDENDAWAQVVRIYDTVLQRLPDGSGLDFHTGRITSGQTNLLGVATDFLNSAEFQAATGSLNNEQFVRYIYQTALDREADAGGLSYWTGQLNAGTSRASMLVLFSETAEHRALTASALDRGYFTTDVNYQNAALLYDTGLGRLPDAGGIVFWGDALQGGQHTVGSMAAAMAGSGEFQTRTAGFSNAQVVDYMYLNTLDRAGDAGGRAYWTAQLDAGLSKADLIANFAFSVEHRALLAPFIDHGIAVI